MYFEHIHLPTSPYQCHFSTLLLFPTQLWDCFFSVVSLSGPVCVAQWVLGVGLALTWSHSTMGHIFTENWFFISQWPSDVHNSLATGKTLFPLPCLCAGTVSDWSLSRAYIRCHSCHVVICESVKPCLRNTIPWYYPPPLPLTIFLPWRFLSLGGGMWLNSRLSMPQSFAH